MKVGEIRTGSVSALAFGGEGIIRDEGFVVFVPFTAPGDVVEVRITEVKKSFARAALLRIITAATERIEPKCAHFGVCGGCQLQHVSYERQLAAKREFVEQSLRRIAKIEVTVAPVIGAQSQWEYRRVVRLRFSEDEPLSYVNATSDGRVPVSHCPIFSDKPSLWQDLNAFIKPFGAGQLSLYRDGLRTVARLDVASDKPGAQLPTCLAGCVINTSHSQRELGDVALGFVEHGLTFRYSPMSFVQAHAEQSEKLSDQVIDEVTKSGAGAVLDLYCGFGVTAIVLAKRGLSVTAIEGNAESIKLAQTNAMLNAANVNWICDDVGKRLKLLNSKERDVVIVNPPRTGLAPPVANALAKSHIGRIVYVSCMPQTLARDVAILAALGYRVVLCQPYDMFPQTTHVETLVVLEHATHDK